MKIKKLLSIKNVGSFKEYEWDQFCSHFEGKESSRIQKIAEFGKKNVFFGDNGNGKSTVVKIFKSLNGGISQLSKNWDLEYQGQEIKIITDAGEILFDGTSWNSPYLREKIHIFDKEFIRNNAGDLHEESENDVSKKRGAHFFTLGEFTAKEEKWGVLTTEKNEINKIIGTDILELRNYLDNFKDESTRIAKKKEFEENLKEMQEKLKNLTAKQNNLSAIKRIDLPGIPPFNDNEFLAKFGVFQEKISSIVFPYGCESAIKEIILSIHKNSIEKCLVCDQVIKDNGEYIETISLLMRHFVGQSVEEKERTMNQKLGDIYKGLERIRNFENELAAYQKNYGEKIEILRSYGDISIYQDINSISFSLSAEEIGLIDNLLLKVSEKEKSKSSVVPYDVAAIVCILEKFQNTLTKLAENIEKNNQILTGVKTQSITSIQNEIAEINKRILGFSTGISIIDNYTKITSFIFRCKAFYIEENGSEANWKLRDSLKDLRSIINNKFSEFIKRYGKSIEQHVKDLNSSISIDFECKLDGGLSHGSARCGLKLSYNGKNIARDLSDGEKRVVALSYFFALTKERTDKSGILVFDDPVTDFDAGHKQIIASKISEVCNEYDQTIVFTHDEKFFEYIKKQNFDSRFSIQKVHRGSVVGCIGKGQRELYEKDLEDFYLNGLSSDEYFRIREHIYKLRYCVESRIKNDGLFHNESTFDRILDGLEKMPRWTKEQIKILKEIYSFCNLNGSHEGSCEGYNGLKKNFKGYCELGYYPLPTTS